MHFRLYDPRDFSQLYAIEEACFQPPLRFSRAYMRQLVNSSDAVTWVAEDAGQLAGFAIIEWSGEPDEIIGYIQTLEVSPEQRRHGLGREILRCLELSARKAKAGQIWLHVDAANHAAIRLYRAEGFRLKGTQANYYGRAHDADVYCKQLAGAPGDPDSKQA